MKQLKFNLLLCLLILCIGSAHAQIPLNWAAFRDAAGLKPIELRTGYNGGSNKLSHSGLNNSGSDAITYYGVHETSLPRYNYSLQLNSYTNNYNYAYLLFDFVQSVPAYARAKVTWTNSCIHLYNMASTVTESAAAFYVFDTVDKARNAALVSTPSSARPADPVDGKLYYYVYSNASSGAGIGSTTYNGATTYFDNSTSSSDRNITKGAMLTTCAKNGNRYQKSFLLIRPNSSGKYVTVTYDYYKHLTYQSNDGTNRTANQTIVNSGNMLPANTFTRKNHIFAGWQSDKVYSAGASVSANKDDKGTRTLIATWTPVKFTLMNGSTQVAQVNAAETLTKLADSNKPTSGDKLFVGYFTEADGKGIQVYDGNLQPTTAGNAENFTSNTTLYAYFISDKHNVIFDYSFRNGDHTYATLSDKIYTCRLQFKNASGAVLKTVYLTAPDATTRETASMTDNIDTHTTSNMLVNLAVGNGANVVSGSEATIYFATQAELEKVHSFQYDVWNTTENKKVEHWETETNEGTNSTIFKYTGYTGDNIFTLSWTVTLHNLAMYPEKIYAKPMVKNNEDTFAQISPMTGVTGLECLLKETDGKTYATYTGEYAVLKTQSSGTAEYKVGMTGFYLDGSDYFLNATHGTIPADLVSSATATSESATISYDIYDYDIPVVLLLPAAPGSGITDATVNYAKKILYVDQARATKVNLSNFVAYRENFDFLGWYDTEWKENGKNKIWGANDVYEFHTHDVSHNGGTRTLIAQWTRSTAPVASVAMTEEANQFKYTITATDDVKVTAVKYLISDTEPAANAGWINGTDNTVTIPRTNDVFGKYLYVMVENEGKNVIVKYNDPIRSFIDIKANPDPDSHDKEVIENGTWEGETFQPDGTTTTVNYYDYYSTFFYSNHTFIADNATVFTAKVNGNHLDLTEIMPSVETGHVVIPQNTAVILCKKHATDGNIVLEERTQSTQEYSNNILEGTDEVKGQDEAGYDYYIFSYAQKGLGFYLNSSDQLAAHKAYFKLPNDQQNARAFTLNFGNSETTAIRDIETTEADSNALYDLSGRQVNAANAKGGIYIKGGKKIIIKK